jgi:hypothetical protein
MDNEYVIALDYELAVIKVKESFLSPQDKKDYLKFVNNFKDLSFYYNTELCMSEPATENEIYFPRNFREYRKILADTSYGFGIEIKFDSFVNYSPRGDRLDNIWYSINPGDFTYNEDQMKVLLENSEDFKFLPIGFTSSSAAHGCYLAINLNDNDKSIYEFHIQDLYDNYSANEPVEQSANPVFDSYPQMLAHISEIKYLDGNKEIIVKARES